MQDQPPLDVPSLPVDLLRVDGLLPVLDHRVQFGVAHARGLREQPAVGVEHAQLLERTAERAGREQVEVGGGSPEDAGHVLRGGDRGDCEVEANLGQHLLEDVQPLALLALEDVLLHRPSGEPNRPARRSYLGRLSS